MFSRKRSTETLADYAVVAISPLLVMFMVGSLVFFLIQIFYQGEFNARLSFVMAMFVMGTVCIARISMEESASYAAPFAGALGVVVFIALLRFVEFRGPLAEFSYVVNLFLMLVVWWSANQLTWDCTLLEGKRDTSGQGLLKRLWRTSSPEQKAPAPHELAGQTIKPPLTEPPESNWWQNWFSLGNKVHTPGLWVAYFTFAALPLFGLGNLFLSQASVETRRYAFQLLVIYVGSAIGLLITTSFLNIRRYLRQRDLEMPVSMTARWLGMGLLIGLAILVVCTILPRRNPEYSVTQLRWAQIEIGSPKQKPNTVAVGPEGTKGNSPSTTPAKQPDPSGAKGAGSSGQAGKSGSSPEPSKDQNQENNRSGSGEGSSGQSGEKGPPNQNSSGGDNSSGQQSGSPMGSSGQKSGDGNQGKEQGNSPNSSSQAKESSAGEPGKEGAKEQQKSEGNSSQPGSPKSEKSSNTSSSQLSDSQGASRTKEPENWNQQNSKQAEPPPPNSSTSSSSPPPAAPPPSSPSKFSLPTMTLGGLIQGLFYLLAVIGAIVLAYYFRDELAAAWQRFLAEWNAFWAGLGKKKNDAQTGVSEPVPMPPPRKRFGEFANPFSAMGRSMSSEALIRYLFDALEAWGADRGLPRKSEQTPQEYVEQLALKFPALAQGLYLLGDLYSQVAYSKGASADNARLTILGKLWQQLQST